MAQLPGKRWASAGLARHAGAQRLAGAPPPGFNWPWRDTFKIWIAAGVMLLAHFLLHSKKDALGLGLGLAAVVGALVYGAAIALPFAPQCRRLLAAHRT